MEEVKKIDIPREGEGDLLAEEFIGYQTNGRNVRDRWPFYRQEDFRGRIVVDLGCSEGLDTRMFVEQLGAAHAIGMDILPPPPSSENLSFIQADAATADSISCDVLVCNSVAKWIGPEAILRWIRESRPQVIYLETHSENDEWSWEVIQKAGYDGWDFREQGRVSYTKTDPRPLRRFLRGTKISDFLLKTMEPHRRLHLGIGYSVLQAFAGIGLPVPEAKEWSEEAYAIRRFEPYPREQWKFDTEVLQRVLIAQWLIGNCSVRQEDGNLIRDEFNSPCHSEAHPGNIGFDGRKMLFFDFDHAFAHLLWLKGTAMTFQPLSEIIPEYEIGEDVSDRFREALALPLLVTDIPSFVLQPNRWLSSDLADLANQIVALRRDYLIGIRDNIAENREADNSLESSQS